jgi:dodecin
MSSSVVCGLMVHIRRAVCLFNTREPTKASPVAIMLSSNRWFTASTSIEGQPKGT